MELSEILQQVDIVEYISQFMELEQKGDEWWGLSCFKQERTPSFSIRKDPPVFYDYASGIGGNIITFIKRYYNCNGYEAVNKLKEYSGITGDITYSSKLPATKTCTKFKHKSVNRKESKMQELPDDYMDRYKKDNSKLSIWLDEGISEESMEFFDVRYDDFSNRIVYPIRAASGKIVNVGGRTLDPDYKEKGIRKYTYFKSWGVMSVIYGLYENMADIKEKREIILFEGCKSVMKARSWGIRNTGAILTSHLNPEQTMLLIKLGVNVVFALDNDVNIRDDHNIQKLKWYVNVTYIHDTRRLLEEKDSPVDKGEEVFRELYDRRWRYR